MANKWKVEIDRSDTQKGLLYAHLKGPRGQYTKITLDKETNSVTGFRIDYESDSVLNELHHLWDSHFRYNESPHYIPSDALDSLNDGVEEDAYDYSNFFESLSIAKDDYLSLKDMIDDYYERYSDVRCIGDFVANEIEIVTPSREKIRIKKDICDFEYLFGIDEFWEFIYALESAYYSLSKNVGGM